MIKVVFYLLFVVLWIFTGVLLDRAAIHYGLEMKSWVRLFGDEYRCYKE